MLRIIDDQAGDVGEIYWEYCSTPEELRDSSFCGMAHHYISPLISQIPDFGYPLAVLGGINIKIRRQGYGTAAMQLFHEQVTQKGAKFALLRIGTQDEDESYSEAVRWRLAFYAELGWIKLVRPNFEHLILEWMYKPLVALSDNQSAKSIRFELPPPNKSFYGSMFENCDASTNLDEWQFP